MVPQQRIQKDVVDELEWDNRLLAADVEVGVDDGTVTLSGSVSSHFARQAAVDDAWHVPGVVEVIDMLGVRCPDVPESPTDELIRSNIANVLAWNPDIDVVDIIIFVTAGVVTLEGTVDAYWKKSLAESLVLGLRGVVSIENRLAIVPTSEISDREIAEAVVNALKRRRHVDPDCIDVTVQEGLITLSGTVPDLAAEESAFDAARYTAVARGSQ